MRKFLLWLGFGGKVLTGASTFFEGLLPEYDAMKAKLREIKQKEEEEILALENQKDEPIEEKGKF